MINCEKPTILWRVDELQFIYNPTETAGFSRENFEIVLRISDHEKYDKYLNL